MHQLDPVDLKQRLSGLTHSERLAFAALILDRAIPNFLRFASETGAAGGAMLRAAQARVWSYVEGGTTVSALSRIKSKICETFAPDSETYNSLYTSSALDAVSITCNVLDYLESKDIGLLVECASLRRDSIDMFLQLDGYVDSANPDFETLLISHPLTQEELAFQDSDLRFLEACRRNGAPAWPDVLTRSLAGEYSKLRMFPKNAACI